MFRCPLKLPATAGLEPVLPTVVSVPVKSCPAEREVRVPLIETAPGEIAADGDGAGVATGSQGTGEIVSDGQVVEHCAPSVIGGRGDCR